ncbi:hypothetical protein [Thiolapillus sp.]
MTAENVINTPNMVSYVATVNIHLSMANNFDPLSANKIDPPGA